jgi:hypothetical protein
MDMDIDTEMEKHMDMTWTQTRTSTCPKSSALNLFLKALAPYILFLGYGGTPAL